MVKIHENFKSFDPKVKDAKAMNDLIGEILLDDFKITTPLWEMDYWQRGELDGFEIDLDKVDRLYYIEKEDIPRGNDSLYYLVCRMDYYGKPVYIKLAAFRAYSCYQSTGTLLISADPNYFIKSIYRDNSKMLAACQSLAADGIKMCNHIRDYEKYYRDIIRGNEPFGKELRVSQLFEIGHTIKRYYELLPRVLRDNLNDFIDFAKNRIHLNDWW